MSGATIPPSEDRMSSVIYMGSVAKISAALQEGQHRQMAGSGLDGQPKQSSNKLILRSDVSLVCSLKLSLPNHVYRLVPLYRSPPGRRVGKESQAWRDSAFQEAMVLLDDVVHILARSSFAALGQKFLALQIAHRADVSRVLVDVDHPWRCDVLPTQHLSKESLRCSPASRGVEEEIQRVARRVQSAIQVHPFSPDLDVGLVNPPGVVGLLQMRPASFIYF